MSNKWRVYLKPFDDTGAYTSWTEITSDVLFNSIGAINSDLDNTDYDIGIFRVNNVKIQVRNDHGLYSDVGDSNSIFKYKRSDTQVKITWEIEEDGPYVGVAESESGYLSEETTMFIGLLSDESLSMSLSNQVLSFTCLGREAIFSRIISNYASLSNGQLYSNAIYTLLNQTAVTNLLTVSISNISCDTDNTIDDKTFFQNKTVQECLSSLLLASNSVLYIKDDTIYVSPRTAGATVAFYFYGQGSLGGVENIADIKNIRSGLNRTLNYFTWQDTALLAQNATSVSKYGVRKKELSFDFCTDTTKRQSVLDNLRDEFGDPKQEFELYTPLNYSSLVINLLDKVSIDYPVVHTSIDNLPICGSAVCGVDVLPRALWTFEVNPIDYYKIIGKSLNVQESTFKFKVRLI